MVFNKIISSAAFNIIDVHFMKKFLMFFIKETFSSINKKEETKEKSIMCDTNLRVE